MFHPDGRPILPGQDHAAAVAKSLQGKAVRVRLLELWAHWKEMPLKGDVSDWIENGGTAEQLYDLIEKTPDSMANCLVGTLATMTRYRRRVAGCSAPAFAGASQARCLAMAA